jgi:hypothetical protein
MADVPSHQKTKVVVGQFNRPQESQQVASQPSLGNLALFDEATTGCILHSTRLFDLCDSNFAKRNGGGRKRRIKDANLVEDNQSSLKKSALKPSSQSGLDEGPTVEIVNGKIVLKESSLVINNNNTANYDEYEEIQEDNRPKATYSSFSKREKSSSWSLDETKLFYDALRQCGTEFTMMETLFFSGRRSRKQLKHKFYREEKLYPDLVHAALNYTEPLNLTTLPSEDADESE